MNKTEQFLSLPADRFEALASYHSQPKIPNSPIIGDIVIVTKGRKFPVGTYGIVIACAQNRFGVKCLVLQPDKTQIWVSVSNLFIFKLPPFDEAFLKVIAATNRVLYSRPSFILTEDQFFDTCLEVSKGMSFQNVIANMYKTAEQQLTVS